MKSVDEYVAVKKQCAGSAGKMLPRTTRSSPRDRGEFASAKQGRQSASRLAISAPPLAQVLPVHVDEFSCAIASRLLAELPCPVHLLDDEGVDSPILGGPTLAWALAAERYKGADGGKGGGVSRLAPQFLRFLEDRVHCSLATGVGKVTEMDPNHLWDLFLWLSSFVEIRRAFSSYCHADFIVKSMFSALSGVHQNPAQITTIVACIVHMLEFHRSASSVLTETNVLQFMRLFISRSVHAAPSSEENLMSQEAVAGCTGFSFMLRLPHVQTEHAAVVDKELSSFVKKWWGRLQQFFSGTSSTTLHAARTALRLLVDIADLPCPGTHGLTQTENLRNLLQEHNAGIMWSVMNSKDAPTALAGTMLLTRLICSARFKVSVTVVVITHALIQCLQIVSDLTDEFEHSLVDNTRTALKEPLKELAPVTATSSKNGTPSACFDLALDIKRSECLTLLRYNIGLVKACVLDTPEELSGPCCGVFFSEASSLSQGRVVLRAVVLALQDARGTRMALTQDEDRHSTSSVDRYIIMDGLLILKKLTEFHSDGELKSSISSEITQTDLYFMESLIDKDIHSWIGDLMDSSQDEDVDFSVDEGLDDTTLMMNTPRRIAADGSSSEGSVSPTPYNEDGAHPVSTDRSPNNSSFEQAFTSLNVSASNQLEGNMCPQTTPSFCRSISENVGDDVVSASALEDWIDQDTQCMAPETPDSSRARVVSYVEAAVSPSLIMNSPEGHVTENRNSTASPVAVSKLASENYKLVNENASQRIRIESLLSKIAVFEQSSSADAVAATDMREEIAGLKYSRDSAIEKCAQQQVIIEDGWKKMSALAVKLELLQEAAAQTNAQHLATRDHCATLQKRLLEAEASSAESRSLADNSLSRVSSCLNENMMLLDAKSKVESKFRAMEENTTANVAEIQSLKKSLTEKNIMTKEAGEHILRLQQDITSMDEKSIALQGENASLNGEIRDFKKRLEEEHAEVRALKSILNQAKERETDLLQIVATRENELSELRGLLQSSEEEVHRTKTLLKDKEVELKSSKGVIEVREGEIASLKTELSKQKEVILYINKLSAETSS